MSPELRPGTIFCPLECFQSLEGLAQRRFNFIGGHLLFASLRLYDFGGQMDEGFTHNSPLKNAKTL